MSVGALGESLLDAFDEGFAARHILDRELEDAGGVILLDAVDEVGVGRDAVGLRVDEDKGDVAATAVIDE